MNLPDIRKQIIHLQQQRQQLELKLIRFRLPMEKGSVVNVYRPCAKEHCSRCAAGQKHGPYLYLNLRIDGRSTQRYVGKKSDIPIVKRARAYMGYQDILAQVRKITKQIDALFNLYRDKLTMTTRLNDQPQNPKTQNSKDKRTKLAE